MRKLLLFSALLIFACSEEDELPVDTDPCSNDSSQIDTDGDGVYNNIDAFPFNGTEWADSDGDCLLYTSPSPRDRSVSRMPSSA